MKEALSYVVSAIIAAGVVEMIGSRNRDAAIMLGLVTLLLVVIANQEKVKALFSSMEVKKYGQ